MESAIYIVATPIGNLSDITLRAIEVLKGVDLIAAEDTRHSARLLDRLDIETPLVSMHEHNEFAKSARLIDAVREGGSLAVISDAGTPLISDPGAIIVEQARLAGIRVVPVPGPSAVVAALSVAGVPAARFIFEGFAPSKRKARDQFFEQFQTETRAVVLYEAPHRIKACLESMEQALPDRLIVLARELTKTFETVLRGTPAELLRVLAEDQNQTKGEFVVVISGAAEVQEADPEEMLRLIELLLPHVSAKTAAGIVAEYVGGKRDEIYQLTLSLKS